MASINIRRDVQDTFYRYKMPSLMAKVEGKGNGIKTVITNMSDIAKSLNRPPSYPTKFFGCELGAQVICDDKSNRYIVNGVHEPYKLQELLDVFITKFVLCRACKNPETELSVAKDGVLYTKCKACGEKKTIIDQQHRLVPFIQKNVPAKPKKSVSVQSTEDLSESSYKRQSTSASSLAHPKDEGLVVDEATAFGNLGINENGNSDVANHRDDDWAEDMSEAAVAKRREKQLDGMSKILRDHLTLKEDSKKSCSKQDDDDDDQDQDQDNGSSSTSKAIEELAAFLETSSLTCEEIYQKISELKLKHSKALVVLPQVLFSKSIKITEDLNKYLALFENLCSDEKCQKSLLGGIERLVAFVNTELQRKLPIILQLLYQEGILDEEILLGWADHPSKKYLGDRKIAKDIRTSATPFIDWLKQASSEESDSNSE
jgi:translation initiation factor 5